MCEKIMVENGCVETTVNRLCLFFPSRLCWQVSEPMAAIEKPCDDPCCINHLAYQKFMKEGLPIPMVLPKTILIEKLGG